MIVQGSNVPIRIEFEPHEALPENAEMSVKIAMPGEDIKLWNTEDLIISEDRCVVEAPITQEESMEWELGKVKIEVKWLDAEGKTQFAFIMDNIVHWSDKTVLEV